MVTVLKSAETHGLNPDDYYYSTLAGWPDDPVPVRLAARDVLATEALIRYETIDENQIRDIMEGRECRPPEDWEEQ